MKLARIDSVGEPEPTSGVCADPGTQPRARRPRGKAIRINLRLGRSTENTQNTRKWISPSLSLFCHHTARQLARVGSRLTAFEAAINKRFDDMREVWRTELRRVEDVLDARLKRL